jgi:hypothetical protein
MFKSAQYSAKPSERGCEWEVSARDYAKPPQNLDELNNFIRGKLENIKYEC